MPLVVPDLGEIFLLDLLLREDVSSADRFLLHLYKNDYSPNRVSELIDFEEATFAGYEVVELARDQWSESETVGGYAVSLYGTGYQQWVATTGDQDIYGYYVTDQADEVVLWAERFGTMVTVSEVNPVLLIPVMRLRSEYQPAPPPPPPPP